jgi:subtilase family serine protease
MSAAKTVFSHIAIFAALASAPAAAAPLILVKGLVAAGSGGPPTYAFCEANFGAACYSPQDIRQAYGLNGLIKAGYVGTGQTIIVVESYGSPTIGHDLKEFDKGYGLPDPPSLSIHSPLGTVPWNPTLYPDQPGWAGETTLDVEWAHAIAPGAAIVVLTSPVAETEGVQGLPQFLKLEQFALNHHLGNIISQSWAATENTLFYDAAGAQGPQVIADYNAFYASAGLAGVTVFASAGDGGTSNPDLAGALYPFPTVNFPASSPFVTSVGGTDLTADSSGNYISETVWSDAGCCAGGGGISEIFAEPNYQTKTLPGSVQTELGGMRGVPDISYNAAVFNEFILIYASFPGTPPGWYGIGGTSEGSPQWAGIVADLNQYVGQPLGFLNPGLYALGGAGLVGLFSRDITVGNNALQDVTGAAPGYSATAGWDPASGWGTPNLADLPPPFALRAAFRGPAPAQAKK